MPILALKLVNQLFGVQQKNHKAYKETRKYDPFKGKKTKKILSLKKMYICIYKLDKDFKISILDAQRTNKICGESQKINENTISRKTENLKRNKQKKSGAEKHHY